MKVVVHKNDGKGLIKVPIMVIAESEQTSAENHLSNIDPSLFPMIVDDSVLPDRIYSRAWDIVNNEVVIDMTIARDIFRDKMRGARTSKLADLDIEFQRAQETGADATDIVAKKQELRDVTSLSSIETAQNIEELHAVWPECLGQMFIPPQNILDS